MSTYEKNKHINGILRVIYRHPPSTASHITALCY